MNIQSNEPPNKLSLIPKKVLFHSPTKAQARISPDGKKISYLAPFNDKEFMNVWVQPTDPHGEAKMLTKDDHRGIQTHTFSGDSSKILYLQDIAGDDNYHLYSTDIETGVVRDLTPFLGKRAQDIITHYRFPNQILVSLSLRERHHSDMYRIDVTTGAITLDTVNPGDVNDWFPDPDFKIRACVASNAEDGSKIFRVRETTQSDWKTVYTIPADEEGTLLGFAADGNSLYATSSLGRNSTHLILISAQDGQELKLLAKNDKCDVKDIFMYHHMIQAVSFEYDRNGWVVLDQTIAGDFEQIKGQHSTQDFHVVSRDEADALWVVAYCSDVGGPFYYLYYRPTKEFRFLFSARDCLTQYQLANMQPVVIKSRDLLDLVCYLTLPVEKVPSGLPLVVLVHGGPWGRDCWGFNATVQWLANRGYAVLQVNFRGSTGLGKKFTRLGDRQWGGPMQQDLCDAIKWAQSMGYCDPARVGIVGSSYGGYAVLAGLAFTPDVYACGVDISGPNNIASLISSLPSHWKLLRKHFTLRIGDVEHDPEFNQSISPLFHLDKMKAPLLVAHGRNDPRVKKREVEQMCAGLRERKVEVECVVYPDEGHGFVRPHNAMDFNQKIELFLNKHLGGMVEQENGVK